MHDCYTFSQQKWTNSRFNVYVYIIKIILLSTPFHHSQNLIVCIIGSYHWLDLRVLSCFFLLLTLSSSENPSMFLFDWTIWNNKRYQIIRHHNHTYQTIEKASIMPQLLGCRTVYTDDVNQHSIRQGTIVSAQKQLYQQLVLNVQYKFHCKVVNAFLKFCQRI